MKLYDGSPIADAAQKWRGMTVQRHPYMPAEFHVEIRGDVVVVVRKGAPQFEDTQKAMAAALAAARAAGTKKILFDVRLADLTNFYSYIVRDVNLDPLLGLDTSFRICVVGSRAQVDVMTFIVNVRQMRGWEAQWFFDMDEARNWLAKEPTPKPSER
jgi:hypothetical protein